MRIKSDTLSGNDSTASITSRHSSVEYLPKRLMNDQENLNFLSFLFFDIYLPNGIIKWRKLASGGVV
jgi:hypothetical protein